MSIKTTNWVWDHSTESGTNKLMLLAIAEYADDDGVCWPSIARLAQRVCVKERQAQRLIKQLEQSGAIEVRRGVGRNHTSVYVIKGVAEYTIPDAEKVQSCTPFDAGKGVIQGEKVSSRAIKGVIAMTPDPSLDPPIDPSLNDDTRATPPTSSSSQALPDESLVATPKQQERVRLPAAAVAQTLGNRDPAYVAAKVAYENNIGMLTPILVQRIEEALRSYPPEWVPLAIERAVAAEKRRWDYIEGILRNWSAEGFNSPGSRSSWRTNRNKGDQPQQPAVDSYADLILQ